MKPIRLEIEHFGPYRDRAEVDFGALGPLFLVWGPTGAGKSTLFDAMAYALYGQLPGARDGQERQLASHHAGIGDEPRVSFEFSLGAEVLKVERRPPHARPKRGGGTTETPARAALSVKTASGWHVEAEKVRDVTERIEQRMHLTFEEFSKIILLPQGEFEEFLKMDAGNRAEVLEKLFPVTLHDSVTALAAKEAQAFVARADALAAEEARLSRDAGDDPGAKLSELDARVEGARTRLDSALAGSSARETGLEVARGRAARIDRAREAQAELARLEEGRGEQDARRARIASAQAAARVKPLFDHAVKAAADARSAEETRALKSREHAGLEARRAEMGALKESLKIRALEIEKSSNAIALLERARDSWERSIQAKSDLDIARTEAGRHQTALDSGRASLEALRAELHATQVTLDLEKEVRLEADAAREAVRAAMAGKDACAAWRALGEAAAAGARDKERVEGARRLAAETLEAARRNLESNERSLEFAHAQRLAASLVRGKPCPVCGSTSHPAPALAAAVSEDNAADADETGTMGAVGALRDAQALFRDALGEDAAAAEALNTARARHADAIDALARFEGGHEAVGGLPESEEAAAEGLRAAEQRLSAASADLAAIEARKERAATLQIKIESARAGLETLASALERAKVDAGRAESAWESARAQSGGEDPRAKLEAASLALDALRERHDADTRRVDVWERALESALLMEREASRRSAEARDEAERARGAAAASFAAEFALGDQEMESALRGSFMERAALGALEREAESFARALSAAESRYAALKADLPREGEAEPDLAALESLLAQAREEAALRSRERDEALRARDALAALLARMEEVRAERRALDLEAGTMLDLARLLKGDISGRRLPFKNFALAMYFRQVVAHASTRLSEMSDGRYALRADEGQASGRGRIGLGISVLDSWTGQARPTQTLSGGERFLAAVSLALGLADTIRMRSGGVSLEAVFIDEGFGSLDEESLDRAITVLDRIRGGRTIGIVSHVAELRSRIASRIEVAKGASGSTLRVV